jgi:phosphonate transport system substrate-binding protein
MSKDMREPLINTYFSRLSKQGLRVKLTSIALAAVFLAAPTVPGAATAPQPESAAASDRAIVLADISTEPAKKIKRFQPLADYLAHKLGDFGIDKGEVKIAPDMATMCRWLKTGKVTLYFDSIYPAMLACSCSGAKPILRRWKNGIAQYHTVFFSSRESGLTSLTQLAGRKIAFEDPLSTSGYMVPLAFLVSAGLNPAEHNIDSSTAEDEIGYIFTGEDQNTIQWVISGRVAAGAVDNYTFLNIPEETRSSLTILAETEPLPRQVVVVKPDIDPPLLEAIETLLAEMHSTAPGRLVLEKFKNTARFDNFPVGKERALERMQSLYRLVQDR